MRRPGAVDPTWEGRPLGTRPRPHGPDPTECGRGRVPGGRPSQEWRPTFGAAAALAAVADLLRGLFSLPTADAPAGSDYAAAIEERYSRPRRCC